jgi:hypothetical protein
MRDRKLMLLFLFNIFKPSLNMNKLFVSLLLVLLAAACSKDAAVTDLTGKSGSITRFAIFQNYLYVLNLNEVQTYSLQDADNPVLVHRLATDYGLETILVYEGTIFIGSTTALYILDLSNPAAPSLLSKTDREFTFFGGCDPVAVKGDYAYSTIKIIQNICGRVSSESALIVYDVSNKTAPVTLGTYPLSIPNGLGYKDDYLFVCDEGTDRLEVFDISDPRALYWTNYAVPLTDPVDLIVNGDRMIVSTKTDFQIFDISDITAIRRVGQIAK